MSKKANPTIIGAFIIGAIVIVTALVLLLSGGTIFKNEIETIMYFNDSVTGLNIGAPVKFRGVQIGTVTNIKLIINKHTGTIKVPVVAMIDKDSYLVKLQDKTVKGSKARIIAGSFIQHGLRAQLKVNSILTGQLYIELDFYPGSDYQLQGDGTIREIPTSETAIQEITKTLEKFPINEALNNISSTMASLNKILSDPMIIETIHSINQTTKSYDLLATQLSSQATTITTNLNKTLIKTNEQLEMAEVTFKHASKTLAASTKMFNTTNRLLRDDSQIIFSLTEALNEMRDAARSVKTLADTLERQPEAILRGKSSR